VRFAVGLAEVGASDTARVGGKGASLGELIRAGIRVPPGFVLTTDAFGEAMAALDPVGTLRKRVAQLDPDDLPEVERGTAEVRRRIERAPVPEPLSRTALAWYQHLRPDCAVAVRSSATSEDSADASFAGLQNTDLGVRGERALLASVRRCWASLYSVESVSYRLRRRLAQDIAMAVVVQEMVDPRSAGVMFTRSPLTGDRSVIAVEAVWGLGDILVGGEVTPDHFIVNKVTGEVVTRSVADPGNCCLTDGELAALLAVARRIEDHFQAPQDIEWAIAGDSGEEVYVLQSRPETVWARRDATPVVPRRSRAIDHVLDVLGGRAAWD
jgi:phosphoenolpyruvate synthase/pyruvate phosphate dikinase